MNIELSFPGGKRVSAQVGNHLIETDQPRELGGEDQYPAPFDLFLASIGTCAGIYVLGFMQARGLDTTGLQMREEVEFDEATHLVKKVTLDITLPPNFPEKYRSSIIRAAENCKVKKSIAMMPSFEVVAHQEAPVEVLHV